MEPPADVILANRAYLDHDVQDVRKRDSRSWAAVFLRDLAGHAC